MIEVWIEPRQLVAGRDSRLAVRFTNTGPATCTDVVFKLELPGGFLLLSGRNRIQIPELRAGADHTYDLVVRPRAVGDFAVESPNFSYRDAWGTPVRVSDFRAELSVLPAASAAMAVLSIDYAGGELALDEWDVLRIRIGNSGDSALRNLTLTIDGPITVASPGPRAGIPALAAGEKAEVSFVVFPANSGRHVPVDVRATFTDGAGRRRAHDGRLLVTVARRQAQQASRTGMRNGTGPDTILYLAASPEDMPPLRSDKEMREVQEQLQLGKYRDRFRLESRLAARFKDIGQALADVKPRIVHFSGHGERDGSLYVEDELGGSSPVTAQGLARLFGLHAATVDCVIVNACHTLRLAEAMVQHIDHVVGMRCAIGDVAAITFSIGFYQGLAASAPVPEAFERGCAFVEAQPSGKPEHDTPVLLTRVSTTTTTTSGG